MLEKQQLPKTRPGCAPAVPRRSAAAIDAFDGGASSFPPLPLSDAPAPAGRSRSDLPTGMD
jgi:hypothetical protein